MSVIDIKNLTFGYEGSAANVFDDVSLRLDTDWRLGLLGRNGKGKTTFLRLLAGQQEYSGTINASVDFQYFPFALPARPLTALQAVEIADPDYELWQVMRELQALELPELNFERPFGHFSPGERSKLLLATLFAKENAFLLIDEPTNHLDRAGREALSRYLSKKSSYIVVSHDRRFLDGCIDHVMSISRSGIEVRRGNMTQFLNETQKQNESEARDNERLKSDIKSLKQSARQTADWSGRAEKAKFGGDEKSGLKPDRGFLGAKAAKLMKRAKNISARMEKAADEKSRLLKNVEREDKLTLKGEDFFKERLLSVSGLTVSYDGIQANEPVTFEIQKGERVLLRGKNGSGKTSVVKAVLKLIPFSGSVQLSPRLKISYVSQDTSCLVGSPDELCERFGLDKTEFITCLVKLGVSPAEIKSDISAYSEGQKKKVLLAKSLCENANLYIWDEPLNFIDVISREQIKNTLIYSNASLLFIEHDADFCDAVATKTVFVEKHV